MPCRRSKLTAATLWTAVAILSPVSSTAQTPKVSASTFRIVVVAGEDAVNIVQQRTATAPIVEVRDNNNQPVAGVAVRFVVRGKAVFFGGGSTASTTTNAVGQATVSQLTATSAGTVRIDVIATFQGQSASATITQTNYATAAQAAAKGQPSQGSGGGLGAAKIVGITAAAAGAAGYVVYDKVLDRPVQPAFGCDGSGCTTERFVANPSQGIAGVTTIFLNYGDTTWAVGRTTFSINWGDGESWSGNPDDFNNMHVYRNAGTFTIRLTITDKSGLNAFRETTVTIRSMTGSWQSEGGTLTLIQEGLVLKGTYIPRPGSGSVSISGRLSGTVDPQLILEDGSSSFIGRISASDSFAGSFSNGPTQTFRRQ